MEESGGFCSPDLDDDADSYGTQASGEFGIIPAEEGLLDDIEMILVGRAAVMGDEYIDTDGTDLVYALTDHSHIPMVDVTLFLTYSFILQPINIQTNHLHLI